MAQRKTQTAAYWQEEFKPDNQDIEFISNQVLEFTRLFTLDEIAMALVKRHCDQEEMATRSELQRGKLYQPQESFELEDKIVFPFWNFALGTVQHVRQGQHPEYGTFSVIGVSFENSDSIREFVADFNHAHALNIGDDQSLANLQGLRSPEELYRAYRSPIRATVKEALEANEELVHFQDQYFLRDLLVEFQEGLFNIADAAIDINNGPLGIDAIIQQMGLVEPGEEISDVLRFSTNYRFAEDERFVDVGPTGQVAWYLKRLEPPEVHHRPEYLQPVEEVYDSSLFDEDLYDLLLEIDDEATAPEDGPEEEPNRDQANLILNYPHWRAGTLPIIPKTESLFPASRYNPVRFEFVDGRTGDTFPGWTALNHKYVFGLAGWYREHNLPVGAYLDIKRTEDPLKLIIDYRPTRTQRNWIRVAMAVNNRLSFQMNTEPLSCKYDELMIIGVSDVAALDRLWKITRERQTPLYDVLCHLFPELSKLNPQSTVHVKTVYNAVNVIYRASPGVVFQELSSHDCFIPMRHGYWTYDPALRDE